MATSNDSATSIGGMDDTIPADALAGGRSRGGAEIRKVKNLLVTDFPAITGPVTSTHTELNVLDGIPATLTATELGYVDGVTSAIQTQLAARATLTGAETLTNKTLTSPVLNTGVSGTAIDTDDTLAADSDTIIPSQSAVKGYVDTQIAGVTAVKSIQTGYVSIAAVPSDWSAGTGEETVYYDVTISSVTAANCVVFIQGGKLSGTEITEVPIGKVTSATNLRICSPDVTIDNAACNVRWTVVEFN